MILDLDHAMAVLKAREEALPWDLTLKFGGKDYTVRKLTRDEKQKLAAITPQTAVQDVRSLVRSFLDLAETDSISDEQTVAAAIAIAIAVAEQSKVLQQTLLKDLRSQANASGE